MTALQARLLAARAVRAAQAQEELARSLRPLPDGTRPEPGDADIAIPAQRHRDPSRATPDSVGSTTG